MMSSNDRGGDARVYRAIEALQRLAEVFAWRREQLASAVGLSDSQWRVLDEIANDDFMPSLFARRRSCTPAAVSRTLRQLQERRLVEARISQRDGRQRDYKLTSRGRAVLERIQELREEAIKDVWSRIDPRALDDFSRLAAELASRLEAFGADSRGPAAPSPPPGAGKAE